MALQKALVTGAGADPRPAAPTRKTLTREVARKLRSAQSDDEATEALEALIELAKLED